MERRSGCGRLRGMKLEDAAGRPLDGASVRLDVAEADQLRAFFDHTLAQIGHDDEIYVRFDAQAETFIVMPEFR